MHLTSHLPWCTISTLVYIRERRHMQEHLESCLQDRTLALVQRHLGLYPQEPLSYARLARDLGTGAAEAIRNIASLLEDGVLVKREDKGWNYFEVKEEV